MAPFLLKLVLTPLLITAATLTSRRWGPVAGGLLVGLPLTSGPVSVFLAIEQGRDFAAAAACSTQLGMLAMIVFCVVYANIARRFRWPVSVIISLACYFVALAFLTTVTLPLLPATLVVLALIFAASLAIRPPASAPAPIAAPWWDLPCRIVAATGIVLAITTLSSNLGPLLSGMLSTFPVFICIMSAFSHALGGAAAATQFLRGVVVGSFAFAVFFLVVAAVIHAFPLPVVYVAATLLASGANLAAYALLAKKRTAS